ncbi:MAG TPA: bifunctional phosphopantothenoylcysteine decarboxylase/phosphopantothenate--cysteine ligase CoaBC [Bacteroidales bacterium]|nr:bifunctional phosphopantothenoylcysteine decarboxylase/phosphopantothenate--cysteine ligase CoaBC [Bacteroidales bacterium]
MLKGKKIIIGLTGSIAAYKAAIIVRLLVKNGAEVKVIMTPLAKEFISPLTLATLSKNPVLVDFYNPENGDWNSHVDLGLWADAYLIAPATANTMAKMASGVADNLLLTTYLSLRCPVFVAPAMDCDMYQHKTTQQNIATLKSLGVNFIEPAEGELASGLSGKGRLEEPDKIVAALISYFSAQLSLKGKTFLVTAGPTYEKIDRVRFIGNYSSGKMGFAIAHELAHRGADVILVSGPTHLSVNSVNIEHIKINTADDMLQACMSFYKTCDAAIMSAAVADFTPVNATSSKLKRGQSNLSLELKPTKDIAAELGRIKRKGQLLVGFALETENETENALLKLKKKNLDFIVLNSLNDAGAGFECDTNKITIIGSDGQETAFPLKSKTEVAVDIVSKISSYFTN